MRAEPEKILNELEQTDFFGTVEIGYQSGIPGHAKISRAVKFDNVDRNTNRTHRGEASDYRNRH